MTCNTWAMSPKPTLNSNRTIYRPYGEKIIGHFPYRAPTKIFMLKPAKCVSQISEFLETEAPGIQEYWFDLIQVCQGKFPLLHERTWGCRCLRLFTLLIEQPAPHCSASSSSTKKATVSRPLHTACRSPTGDSWQVAPHLCVETTTPCGPSPKSSEV